MEVHLQVPATTMISKRKGAAALHEPNCSRCGLIMLHEREYSWSGGREAVVWRCWVCYRDVIMVARPL